jgi:phosphonate transport system substrate-binding protein
MPSSSLDDRFTDADGDLIADIPTDPAELVDPGTLIFAYTPVEDPAVYAEVWQGFLDHMSEVTGKNVQFFPVQSNAAQIEAMRAGRLHVAGFNTGSNPLAVACAGFRPFAMMAAEDGSFGYEMEIITYPDSGIESVEDLRGQTLAFTSETSNSGFKAPSAILKASSAWSPAPISSRPFRARMTTRSSASPTGLPGGGDRQFGQGPDDRPRGGLKADQFVTIYTSQTFPTTGYGTAHNLAPELQEKIREAFFSFDWEGSALAEEFGRNGESQFIPITFKDRLVGDPHHRRGQRRRLRVQLTPNLS